MSCDIPYYGLVENNNKHREVPFTPKGAAGAGKAALPADEPIAKRSTRS